LPSSLEFQFQSMLNDLAASSNAFWAASRQTRSAAWGERFASAAKAQSRF
jgi:hypothetical protein